jgi:opacity protein-like surface antigen
MPGGQAQKEQQESMRRTKRLFICALALMACSVAATAAVSAQESFTSESDDYALELPSEVWKAVPRPDNAHRHTEFVNGERSGGYLRVRREMVEGDTNLSQFARAEADTKLRFTPGFVGGKEEHFAGRLNGIVTNYEYTSAGRAMAGRVYYLQADGRTVYVLHFTGLRDKLQRIQNQTDAIARSFRLKQ